MSSRPDLRTLALARVGTTLRGKWTLDTLLGVGGMGAVFAARHRNGVRAAVKLLHRDARASTVERFLREGRLTNAIDHPGVLKVLDDDVSEDGSVFLVMQLLEGETLQQRVRRKGALPDVEALAITDRVLDVLAAAHERGILHRDVKPDNVFFTVDRRVMLIDFGIARQTSMVPSAATRLGVAVGTPAFMSPEQARGDWTQVDARSDLYAAGATLFFALTRQRPHEAKTAFELISRVADVPARSLAEVLDAPPELVSFVDRALAFDPAERFADARAMQRALRHTYAMLEERQCEATVQIVLGDVIDHGAVLGASIDDDDEDPTQVSAPGAWVSQPTPATPSAPVALDPILADAQQIVDARARLAPFALRSWEERADSSTGIKLPKPTGARPPSPSSAAAPPSVAKPRKPPVRPWGAIAFGLGAALLALALAVAAWLSG